MKEIVLHSSTRAQIESIIKSKHHAIAIAGKHGSGKLTVAKFILETILESPDLQKNPNVLILTGSKDKPLGIEDVRKLQNFLNLKVIGNSSINRAVILEKADTLSIEAQNALLKTLEEPPEGTVIIITASNLNSLLPTIRSRVQIINVVKPEINDLKTLSKELDNDTFKYLYSLSGGMPGLFTDLHNSKNPDIEDAAVLAREILTKSTYDKLLMVDTLTKDKALLMNVFVMLQQMAQTSLIMTNNKNTRQWKNVLIESLDAKEALSNNSQAKLILINFMISI